MMRVASLRSKASASTGITSAAGAMLTVRGNCSTQCGRRRCGSTPTTLYCRVERHSGQTGEMFPSFPRLGGRGLYLSLIEM